MSDEELVRTALSNTLELAKGFAERDGDPVLSDFFQFLVAFAAAEPFTTHEAEWEAAHQPITPAEGATAKFVALMAAYARDSQDQDAFLMHVRLAAELAARFVRFEDGST